VTVGLLTDGKACSSCCTCYCRCHNCCGKLATSQYPYLILVCPEISYVLQPTSRKKSVVWAARAFNKIL